MKKAKKRIKVVDTTTTINFIIFSCAFYDFTQFILSINTHKFINISSSITSRLGGFIIFIDILFYYFALKFPIMRHQLFWVIIIDSCLWIIIITEFLFQDFNIFLSYGQLIYVFFLSFIRQLIRAMIELNEEYLYECDNSDPFYVLLFEEVYGFILSFVYALFYNPLKTIKDFKKSKTSSEFIILILSLIIYIVLSAMKNLYRVNTTKIFSSITTVTFEYL